MWRCRGDDNGGAPCLLVAGAHPMRAHTGCFWPVVLPVDGWEAVVGTCWQRCAVLPAGLAPALASNLRAADPTARGWPVRNRTVDAPHGSAGDCSDRGQHCGQPTQALLEQAPVFIPRGGAVR